MERLKTCFLMVILMLLFMFVGNLIGGQQGMFIAFIVALGMNFFSYFFSDKMVLKHYRAVEVSENDAQGLYEIVARLSQKAGTPMPRVYIIPDQVPNAFATGRNPSHAVVACTEGLLNILNKEEIEGVLAHEMSHVRHYDILIGSIAAVFAGAIAMLANFAQFGAMAGGMHSNEEDNGGGSNALILLIAAIVMPVAATIIQMSISRSREYKADEGAARLTGHPEWLISALQKLESYSQNYMMQNATPQTSHLFIVSPFSGGAAFSNLFRTHPTTEDRIQRLSEITL